MFGQPHQAAPPQRCPGQVERILRLGQRHPVQFGTPGRLIQFAQVHHRHVDRQRGGYLQHGLAVRLAERGAQRFVALHDLLEAPAEAVDV
jgi:hypothetical protein